MEGEQVVGRLKAVSGVKVGARGGLLEQPDSGGRQEEDKEARGIKGAAGWGSEEGVH